MCLELLGLLLGAFGLLQGQAKREPTGDGIDQEQVHTIEDATGDDETDIEVQMRWLTSELAFELLEVAWH